MQQKCGKLLRKPMARRIAIEFGKKRIESPPCRRFGCRLGERARNLVGGIGLIDQPFDGGNTPVTLAGELTGEARQQAQRAATLDFGREHQPASGAFGFKFGAGLKIADRAVEEFARLHDAAVFLPFAESLFPIEPQRAKPTAGNAPNAAVDAKTLLDAVGREADHFVDACAVGDERPDRFRRFGEMPFLAKTVTEFISAIRIALAQRRRGQ
jgi:hypothetical protein